MSKLNPKSPTLWLAVIATVLAIAAVVTAITGAVRESPAEKAYTATWADIPAEVDRAAAEKAMMHGSGWAYRDTCRVRLLVGGRIIMPDVVQFRSDKAGILQPASEMLWGCPNDPTLPDPKPEGAAGSQPIAIPYIEADAQAAILRGNSYQWQEVYENGSVKVAVLVPGSGIFRLDRQWFDDPSKVPTAGQAIHPMQFLK